MEALKLFLSTLRSLSAALSLDPVSGEARINLQLGDITAPEMTLEEIGEKFGLTRERVRQIKEKAIRRLRHNTKNKLLKTYLGQ